MSELGPLQREIMETMWQMRRSTVQDVLDKVNARRARAAGAHDAAGVRKTDPLAYTTVMTVMTQLWEKKLLTRRKIGRAYVYRPTSDERGYHVSRLQEFIANLLGRNEGVVASHLLDALEDEGRGRVDELVRELRERRYIE